MSKFPRCKRGEIYWKLARTLLQIALPFRVRSEGLTFSPCGRWIAGLAVTSDQIRVWDMTRPEWSVDLFPEAEFDDLIFLNEETLLAVCNTGLLVDWHLPSGRRDDRHRKYQQDTFELQTARFRDGLRRQLIADFCGNSFFVANSVMKSAAIPTISRFTISPRQHILSQESPKIDGGTMNIGLTLRTAVITTHPARSPYGHPPHLAIHQNGDRVASRTVSEPWTHFATERSGSRVLFGDATHIRISDWQDNESSMMFRAHDQRMTGLIVAPDDSEFATCSASGLVRIWSWSGDLIETLDWDLGPLCTVTYSADGGRMAVAAGMKLLVWDRD